MVVKKSKKSARSIISTYKDCFYYIGDSRGYIYFGILLFVIFLALAIFLPIPPFLNQQIQEMLKGIILSFQGLNLFEIISFIFSNNLLIIFTGMVLGVLFGIFPFLSLIINGYVIGFVFKNVVGESGFFSLWKILPYGIFELMAVFIGLGLAMKLGMSFFAKNFGSEFLRRALISFRIFVLVILPLLLVAAVIEGILIFFIA